jgi:hypothetical protein
LGGERLPELVVGEQSVRDEQLAHAPAAVRLRVVFFC